MTKMFKEDIWERGTENEALRFSHVSDKLLSMKGSVSEESNKLIAEYIEIVSTHLEKGYTRSPEEKERNKSLLIKLCKTFADIDNLRKK